MMKATMQILSIVLFVAALIRSEWTAAAVFWLSAAAWWHAREAR